MQDIKEAPSANMVKHLVPASLRVQQGEVGLCLSGNQPVLEDDG